MRNLRILGVALAAAFALAAIGTATASAALPEVLQCGHAKLVAKKYTGKYDNSKCVPPKTETEKKAVEKGEGKYEIEPWNLGSKTEKTGKEGVVKTFTGKSGIAFLEIYHLGPVKCTKGSDTGQATGPKTVGNITVIFTGCELTKNTCSNTTKAGEIKTKPLKGTIGYFDEEFKLPVTKAVGIELSAEEPGGYLAEFSCSTVKLRVSQSVIGEVKPPYNVFTKEVKLSFRQASGEQAIQSFEGEAKANLLTETFNGNEWNPGVESGQSGEAVNKGEELELEA